MYIYLITVVLFLVVTYQAHIDESHAHDRVQTAFEKSFAALGDLPDEIPYPEEEGDEFSFLEDQGEHGGLQSFVEEGFEGKARNQGGGGSLPDDRIRRLETLVASQDERLASQDERLRDLEAKLNMATNTDDDDDATTQHDEDAAATDDNDDIDDAAATLSLLSASERSSLRKSRSGRSGNGIRLRSGDRMSLKFVQEIKDWIMDKVRAVIKIVKDKVITPVWNFIKKYIVTPITNIFKPIIDWVKGIWGKLKRVVKSMGGLWGMVKKAFAWIKSIPGMIFELVGKVIKSIGKVLEAIVKIAGKWVTAAKKSAGFEKKAACHWSRNIPVIKYLCFYPMLALHMTWFKVQDLISLGIDLVFNFIKSFIKTSFKYDLNVGSKDQAARACAFVRVLFLLAPPVNLVMWAQCVLLQRVMAILVDVLDLLLALITMGSTKLPDLFGIAGVSFRSKEQANKYCGWFIKETKGWFFHGPLVFVCHIFVRQCRCQCRYQCHVILLPPTHLYGARCSP